MPNFEKLNRLQKEQERSQQQESVESLMALPLQLAGSLDLLEVETRAQSLDFDQLIATVQQAQQIQQRGSAQIGAFIGTLLLRAQALSPHGDFLSWLKTAVPGISRRTAYNYMDLARYWEELQLGEKFATVANFSLREAYAAIADRKRQQKQALPLPKVEVVPRPFFQEPRRLSALSRGLQAILESAEPQTREEQAILRQMSDLLARVNRLRDRL